MPLYYNRLSPLPGIYGHQPRHQRGHSSLLVEMFGVFVFRGAKHTLSTYFPGGYRDPKVRTFFIFIFDLFIMFNWGLL